MNRSEFVLFYAGLPMSERTKPAVKLTYQEVWRMLEIFKNLEQAKATGKWVPNPKFEGEVKEALKKKRVKG